MSSSFETFRALHRGPGLLMLPNAWDAASARIFEDAGAVAIATTSSGVAWSLGYPDGCVLPIDLAVGVTRNIARVVAVPLSIDLENGYSDDPGNVAANVMRIVDAGAVGINIEDGADAPVLLARKIEAIKNKAGQLNVAVFVNARTDVYLASLVDPNDRVAETLSRARIYADAGADCFFAPGIAEPQDIRLVAQGQDLPLNVLVRPGLAAGLDLEHCGVRRLSAGGAISQKLWHLARGYAEEFLATGSSTALTGQSMPYQALQALFP